MSLCCYLLPWKSRGIYEVLPFIVSRDISLIGNTVPDQEFYWSAHHEFYTRLGIWNGRSVWSTDRFVRKFILLHKNESFLEKNQFYSSIFFQASQNPVRKRKVSKTEVVIQSLAIKCYHEIHLSFHKDLEMLILAAPFLLLIKKIL